MVQTTGLPMASASCCQVRPLASRAAMICWVISSRVMQPSSARRLRFASRSVGAELESRLSLHSGDRFLVASSSSRPSAWGCAAMAAGVI